MKKLIYKSLVVFMALIFFIMSSGFIVFEHFCQNCEELQYHALFHNHDQSKCDIEYHNHEENHNCCSIYKVEEKESNNSCSQVLIKFDYQTITSDKDNLYFGFNFPLFYENKLVDNIYNKTKYTFIKNYVPPPKYLDVLKSSCVLIV